MPHSGLCAWLGRRVLCRADGQTIPLYGVFYGYDLMCASDGRRQPFSPPVCPQTTGPVFPRWVFACPSLSAHPALFGAPPSALVASVAPSQCTAHPARGLSAGVAPSMSLCCTIVGKPIPEPVCVGAGAEDKPKWPPSALARLRWAQAALPAGDWPPGRVANGFSFAVGSSRGGGSGGLRAECKQRA